MSEIGIYELTQLIGIKSLSRTAERGDAGDWLKRVRDNAYDLRAEFARERYDEDREWELLDEAASGEVPVWTNQLWEIWVQLSGYAYDESHYRDEPTLWGDDINNIPRLDLYQMAHRIFAEIVMKGYTPLHDTR